MVMHNVRSPLTVVLLALAAAGLAGCNALTRVSEIGQAPGLTHIQDPTTQPGYHPVSLPQPAPQPSEAGPNSLWRPGARAFFKDQRAKFRGDLLTVNVNIQDTGQITNTTARSRTNAENESLTNLYGLETQLAKILPSAFNPANAANLSSSGSSNGTGSVNRSETIQIKMAAEVTQVMPDGNLVIQGRQEVRVNNEVRELVVAGVIRPEDIDSQNSIDSSKIAEARISYGGRGQITDVQQPRYGQQLLDILLPF